jgi:hypothetical protein
MTLGPFSAGEAGAAVNAWPGACWADAWVGFSACGADPGGEATLLEPCDIAPGMLAPWAGDPAPGDNITLLAP